MTLDDNYDSSGNSSTLDFIDSLVNSASSAYIASTGHPVAITPQGTYYGSAAPVAATSGTSTILLVLVLAFVGIFAFRSLK